MVGFLTRSGQMFTVKITPTVQIHQVDAWRQKITFIFVSWWWNWNHLTVNLFILLSHTRFKCMTYTKTKYQICNIHKKKTENREFHWDPLSAGGFYRRFKAGQFIMFFLLTNKKQYFTLALFHLGVETGTSAAKPNTNAGYEPVIARSAPHHLEWWLPSYVHATWLKLSRSLSGT